MSIVCTSVRGSHWIRTAWAATITAAILLLTGCISDDRANPTAVLQPPATAETPATPSPTSGPTPTATYTAALEALLVPGPSLPAPAAFFFLNGDDLWLQPGEAEARVALTDRAIGPWAQTPDGTKAAVVVYDDGEAGSTEDIRIVQPDLSLSEPIFGPNIVAEGDGTAIAALSWSWDGTALAVAFAGGTISLVENLANTSAAEATVRPVDLPEGAGELGPVLWAPNGAGVALLAIDEDERGSLFVAPNNEPVRRVFTSTGQQRAIRTFDWLAGRGRLIFVEQANASPTGAPGSIFTIAPDGTALELLVSSGQFAPAASVALIAPSRDGRQVAFTVHVPDANGVPLFASLWVQTIDSGELVELAVEPGYRVTDLWWTSAGLCWRGVDLGARGSTTSAEYSGTEPFILGRSNIQDGTSTVIYRSNPRTR